MPTVSFTATEARAGTSTPIVYLEFYLEGLGSPAITTYRWGDRSVSIGDEPIEGRILSWSPIRRALSNPNGDAESTSLTITVDDTDRLLAGLFVDADDRYWISRQCALFVTTEDAIRDGDDPLVLFRGVMVEMPKRAGALTWQLTFQDVLTSQYGALFAERMLPERTISSAVFTDAPASQLGKPAPYVYGEKSDEGAAEPRGVVPLRYVGTEDIDRNPGGAPDVQTYLRLLVCAQASKEITEVYLNGSALGWIADAGIDVLIPDRVGWHALFDTIDLAAPPYRDIGSQRWTMVYVHSGLWCADDLVSGAAVLYANMQGIEATGDGSGTLITSRAAQFLWFLQNIVFGTANTVPLSTLEFADGSDQIDEASFAQLTTDLTSIGAQVGAGVFAPENFVSVRDAIAEWCRSCQCDLGPNQGGALAVHATLSSPSSMSAVDATDVIDGTFDVWHANDRWCNIAPYVYGANYRGEAWLSGSQTNPNSITHYKRTRRADEVVFTYVDSATVAAALAALKVSRGAFVPQRCKFGLGLWPLSLIDLASTVPTTHFDGLGATGWDAVSVRVEAIEFDPTRLIVTLEGTNRDNYAGILESAGVCDSQTGADSNRVVPLIALAAANRQQDLGGSRQVGGRSTDWTDAYEYRDVEINWPSIRAGAVVTAVIERRTVHASTSVTARLYNLSDATIDVTGAPSSSTNWTEEALVIPRPADGQGKLYRLQWQGGTATRDVFVVWIRLQVTP